MRGRLGAEKRGSVLPRRLGARLLALSTLLLQTVPAVSANEGVVAVDLEPLEHPDLSSFDRAVGEQLAAERQYLDSLLGDPEKEPELARALLQIGRLYQAYDLIDLAGACYRSSLRLRPKNFEVLYYLAVVDRRQGRLREAAANLDAALEIEPYAAAALVRRGRIELESGAAQPALAYFERALAADPSCVAARFWKGEVYRALGDLEQARALFEASLAEQPAAIRVHYPLADVLRRLGDQQEAAEQLQLSQQPVTGDGLPTCPDPLADRLAFLTTGAPIHLIRGRQAGLEGRLEAELEEYRRAAELAPDEPLARQSLGSALARSGAIEAAIVEFREAVRLDPGVADLHHDLGVLALRLGRLDEARHSLEEALRLRPDYPRAWLQLAEVHARQREFATAIELYDRVLVRQPDDDRARRGRMMALLGAGRSTEGLAELGDLLDRRPPDDPREHLQLAWALGAMGDVDRALRHLASLLALDVDADLLAQIHLRMALLLEGRAPRQEVLDHLEEALALAPKLLEARQLRDRLTTAEP